MLGRRLALGYLDCRLPRFRCRRSIIALRSIHLSPNSGRAEALTQPAEQPVPPPAADPRWVMLSTWLRRSDTVPDANTVAESHTSTGRAFRVSANLAAPPTSSFLIFHDREGSSAAGDGGEDRDDDDDGRNPGVVSAHRDSVLFEIEHRLNFRKSTYFRTSTYDYFVYRSGAAGRPPSLSLLPTHDFSNGPAGGLKKPQHPREQILFGLGTGILRRSEDELLVVELDDGDETGDEQRHTADLHVLRLGSSESEWKKEAVPIVLSDGSRYEMLFEHLGMRMPDSVVPVGDRFLCWVKYSGFILVCDMADPNLMLRLLALPVLPREGRRIGRSYIYEEDDDNEMQQCRNMCAAGAGAVRLVSIDPRCCCGGPGRGTCPHSSSAFTVTTWTMSLRTDEQMTWVKDGVMDCEELWAVPGYQGLPRVPPHCPVVSAENPDVVCFKVNDGYRKVWMLQVDTRRKALLSVLGSDDPFGHLPAKLG